ncbi:hypothetical protein KHA80_22545 [Anaerobacillus sp. HL2]|nr:hypothetical protein KHA80_22545 [Anaerobacillus sp. HL2]
MAKRIVLTFVTARMIHYCTCFHNFFSSMIIANDLALITFLPLGYYVLKNTNSYRYTAFTFILQNIAANLGGMLTPF